MFFHVLTTFLLVQIVTCAADTEHDKELYGNQSQVKPDGQCRTCYAGGETRAPNQPFQFTEGCYRYNCFCKCDGGWSCPKERTVDICNTNITTGCYYCNVHGERYQGNSRFKHTDGCIEYSCTCNCDGSWDCPGDRAVDKCNTNPDTGCYYCTVDEKRYEGNSYFKHVNGCVEYRCVCNCDGSWNCPGEDAVDVCRTNLTTGCYYCEADGYLYQGNSRFPLVRDCYRFSCSCACDGGWTCKDSIGTYVCDENGNVPQECKTCNIEGVTFRGDSMFFYETACIKYMCTCDCHGRHLCSADDARITCAGRDDIEIKTLSGDASDDNSPHRTRSPRQTPRGCRPCNVDGTLYQVGEEFQRESGCNIFTCTCFCDGHHECPAYRTRLKEECKGPSGGVVTSVRTDGVGGTQVSTCRRCEYKDREYDNGPVQIEQACWQLNCNCYCNGTLLCPSERSEWICGGRPQCQRCNVEVDGESFGSFAANSDFSIKIGRVNYNCSCYCDGGWKCGDGSYVGDYCSGCTVDSYTYAGNSSFQLTRGCERFTDCYCQCGGDWECSGKKIEDVCGLCRKCKIGDRYYDGETSNFEASIGFVRYTRCDCECDGKWTCRGGIYGGDRGDQSVDGAGCEDCVIGRQRYRPGASFSYETECYQHNRCECKCGDIFCREVTDTCGNCRSCQIGRNVYEEGEKFSLKQGCIMYKECECSCDGQWSCSGENALDTCNACKKCNVDGTIYDPYSRFNMDRGCWLYKCFCGCDGAARCPSLTAVNTCNVPDDCRSCDVRGTSYPGNAHFEFQISGLTMTCKCNCDGSYICIAEWINWVKEQIDISGSGIGSGAGRCLTCFMNNRYYKGNSNYVIEKAGVQLNCSCYCNGGYYCYGEKTFEDQSCRGCSIFGRKYEGESSFPLIYRGLKLTCSCSCDGSYFCVGADQQMVVQCVRGSGCLAERCSQCVVDGVSFDGGDVFGTVYKGVELRCECGCDGSYYCEGAGGLILTCFGGSCRELGCTSCSVFGKTYTSGSNFEIIYKGLKLDCSCDCGNYQCFGSSGALVVSCIDGGPGCLLSECQRCFVNSRPYAGGSTFSYNYNGIEMECTCGCDGSYFCAGVTELIEIACVNGVCTRLGCQPCNLFGRTYEGDSSFDIIYSGVVLQCQCSCDASYRCVGSTGVTVVCQNGRGCLPSTCSSCIVNGREYAGRSEFRASYKGIDILCRCGCDGTSHCTGVTTSIEVSCIAGTCTRVGCRECNMFGTEYLGNSQFDIIYQGVKLTCECDCDSSYICRGGTGETIVTCANGIGCLPTLCRPCVVDGNTYAGLSTFPYVYNGFNMQCSCGCDGSYFCQGVIEKISISCVGGTCNPVGCKPCRLYNQEYTSLSSFDIIYGGSLLNCKCQCDGSYQCVSEAGIVIVQCSDGRGCLPTLCGSCILDGQSYAAGSTFRYLYNGYDVNCQCGCDGSVYCTGISSKIVISCIGGRCNPIGCQSCRVFGRDYAGLSSFDIIYEGLLLTCTCDCLGGYICQGEGTTTKITCKDSRGCLPQRCDSCIFDRRSYPGGSVFKYNYKNIDFSCTCGCDGSVYCQGIGVTTVLRCLNGECTPLGCQNCNVFGRQYPSLSKFDIIYQGVRLKCDCGCLGDYICVGSTGTTVVQCLAGGRGCLTNTCRNCVLGGREHRAGSTFRHLYEGIEMECTCSCDGSSFCTGVTEVIEISCIGERCSPTNCRNCNIFGNDYGFLSSFKLIYKGVRIDCRCECDGSYVCTGSTGESVVECLADGRGCLPSTCRNCIVNGREYRAGSMFPSKYKDIDMNCHCGCDGSSFCEGITEVITISCIGDTCSPIGCRNCNIFGQNYAGDSRFELVYRGVKMQCECKCDTSYRCVGSTGESQINCREGRTCLPSRCRKCRVNVERHDGNSRFQTEYQGITMDCICGCDGSYFCQGTRTDIEISCPRRGSCTQIGGCRSCSIFGIEFQGNTRKSFVYQGYNMDCECSCDSSYRCVGTKGQITTSCEAGNNCLPPPCRSCTVEGRIYPGNSEFSLTYKGINMRCVCGCDSSYFCQGTKTDIQISCPYRGDCTQIGCRPCHIFGIEFEGGTRKQFVYQGFNMDCECSCDSSYRCIGVKGQLTTQCAADENCLPPPCRSCTHEGRTYPGNSRFSTVYNGIRMDCVCGCDSSYFCRGEDTKTEISCLKDVPCRQVGCRTCLSDGIERLANTEFEKIYDGIRMNCLCNCDGSYRCQGVRVTITISCNGEACSLVGCRSCLYNNQEYKYGSTFETSEGGVRRRCTCECDGSHRCEEIRPACQSCYHDGETHEGNTRYRVYRGSDSFICECKCNGQHRCEPERIIRPTCYSCDIFGRTYEGNSKFKTDIRSLEYDCTCNCNGTWRCISDLFGYSCEGTDCGTQQCTSCSIDGRSFRGDTRFSEIVFGQRMNCGCFCDGRYRCESDSQTCTNSGCQSKCRECEIGGRRYPGDTTAFQAYLEGRLMTCQCDCSGSYRCESEQWTCTSTAGCVSRCRSCSIEGRAHEGSTEFQEVISGTRMSCSCDCSGSYTCRGGNLICTSAAGCRSTCNSCVIDGISYDANPQFYVNVQGLRMQCSCDCSGSYTCQTETRICTSVGGCTDRCVECEIDGRRYKGNTRFEIDHSMGIRMTCECRCNGGYTCNGTKETTTCIGSGCPDVGCQDCIIDGVAHRGGSTFEVQRGRVRMQCTCDCNGGYKCRGEETITTCEGPGCPGQCGPCNVEGRVIEGNTRFTHVNDGIDLQCVCRCDGGYSCEGTKVCHGSGCRTTGCKRCTIDGRHYTGNTRFRIALANVDYDCTCFCDGSYSCTSSTGIVQSCVGSSCAADQCRNCVLDSREYELDSRFRLSKNNLLMNCICECDGAYRCFSISGTCVGPECDEYGCKSCIIDGNTYKGNAEHRITRGGRDLVCDCQCSGHYTCRYPSLQVECVGSDCGVGGCRECNVDGTRYAGNSRFQITKYGLSMQCACNCDSSYTCRGYQIISTGQGPIEDTCRTCEINGRTYNGNTRFQAMINGVRSVCSCDCQGRYSCQGATPTCRSCVIGDESYPGNNDFVLTRDRSSIRCRCDCNGDFVCTGRQEETGVIGGCRDCFIFGTRYKGDTSFTTDARGIRMLCDCYCNGGYSCKGYRTVTAVTLPSEKETTCASCYDGRRRIEGNTNFQIERGCFLVDCVCRCDGSWECPYQVPKFTCYGEQGFGLRDTYVQERYSIAGSHVYTTGLTTGDSRTVITSVDTTSGIQAGSCRSCLVNNQEYEPNTQFTLQDGCLRFQCACDCSGGWNCTSVEGSDCGVVTDTYTGAQNQYTESSNQVSGSPQACHPCDAFGTLHPPNKKFAGEDECYLYSCYCNCDGSWNCPSELTVKTCQDTSDIYNPARGTCRQCVIGEDKYNYGETFELVRDCIRYICTCDCDGSYQCPSAQATRYCRTGSGAPGRIPNYSSRTDRGSSSSTRTETSDGTVSGRTTVRIRPPGDSSGTSGTSSSSSSTSTRVTSTSTRRTSTGTSSSSSSSSGSTSRGGSSVSTSVSSSTRTGSSTGGGGTINLGSVLASSSDDCKDCIVDDQPLKGGRDFTYRSGCKEYLCECFCNGTYVCPPERSTNFCDKNRGGDNEEESRGRGCTVGNRTYYTKLFSYTENCLKYICRCYDNGSYNCDPNKTRKVC